eukprot:ANDGO_08025.mRNA.1 ABC transporter F family member 3
MTTSQEIRGHVSETVGPKGFQMIEQHVLDYMLDLIVYTCSSGIEVPRSETISLVSQFLHDAGVGKTVEESHAVSSAIFQKLSKAGILGPEKTGKLQLTEEDLCLADGVSLERSVSIEASLLEARLQREQRKTTTGNANQELKDWDATVANRKKEKQKGVSSSKATDESQRLAQYFKHLEERRAAQERIAENQFLRRNNESSGGSKDIICSNFDLTVGNLKLLDDTSLTIGYGRRYGLIGRNGTGKTTLLRRIAEYELEGVPKNLQILHVEQEIMGDDMSALETVLASDRERAFLLKEEARLLADPDAPADKLKNVYDRMSELEIDMSVVRATEILSGLQFTLETMHFPTRNLSGGWKMRVALARALFVSPDVLLLDEPTNHLDLHAVFWLEGFLKSWTKSLIVVSHSQNFLNSVVTDIVYLQGKKLKLYHGNYSTFDIARQQELVSQSKQNENQEKQKARLMEFIDQNRSRPSTAKLAQSRLKVLEKMGVSSTVSLDPSIHFSFPQIEEILNPPLLQAFDVAFAYNKDAKPLFSNFNCNITLDSRIAIVGANGTGKTTLLHILAGDLQPTRGSVWKSSKIRISLFTQHSTDSLSIHMSALENMCSQFPRMNPERLRAQLGTFGISGDTALQPLYTLSGGQKCRVAFAAIALTMPHILLLDEPTNHLDMETVQALIDSLTQWNGGLIMVSHDELVISAVCNEILYANGESVDKFPGDFEDYKQGIVSSLAHQHK